MTQLFLKKVKSGIVLLVVLAMLLAPASAFAAAEKAPDELFAESHPENVNAPTGSETYYADDLAAAPLDPRIQEVLDGII